MSCQSPSAAESHRPDASDTDTVDSLPSHKDPVQIERRGYFCPFGDANSGQDFVEKIQKQEQKKNILNKEFAETLVVH